MSTGLLSTPPLDDPIGAIVILWTCHRAAITRSLVAPDNGNGTWALDATVTALFTPLSYWGERHEPLEVYCDQSKPLQQEHVTMLFDKMVGRTEKIYQYLGNSRLLLTFNLKAPIQFVDSVETPEIQLADMIAAAAGYALRNRQTPNGKKWLKSCAARFDEHCVLPDLQCANVENPRALLNAVVLYELVNRSVRGTSLLDGMAEFIGEARRTFVSAN